jgi:3-oxoacyl-[acyl-carrier protein] reductase
MSVALVTGGATGIGAACCRELARAGCTVLVHYHSSEARAKELVGELARARLLHADLSEPAEVDRLHDQIADGGGIDILVNNAGMTIDAPLFSARLEELDRVLATNLRSTWYLTKRVARLMMRKRAGRIVNISSVVGSIGNPAQSVYGMTKAAIDNLTRTAAQELAPYGILVNAVAPGFIQTAMTERLPSELRDALLARIPLGRMGQPEDVARLVRFLALEGSYCTGAVFHVNGGMYGG